MHKLTIYLVIIMCFFSNFVKGFYFHRFGYSKAEQKLWQKSYSSCAGKFQSPIAISMKRAIPLLIPAIEMIGYHNLLPGPLLIHNNGHSASLSVPKLSRAQKHSGERLPYIFGGLLTNEYELEGLHFHWGYKNNRGAEHMINDIRHPMEMHIVHRNRKYKDMNEALMYTDGIAVLGFFYQIKEKNGKQLENISDNLDQIRQNDQSVSLNSTFSLHSLIGDIDLDRFYTYKGSLTTPPCSESVTWILFPDTLTVSVSQMSHFRKLSNGIEGSLLVDNYRSLQSIGNRRIFVREVNTDSTLLNSVDLQVHYSQWDWLH